MRRASSRSPRLAEGPARSSGCRRPGGGGWRRDRLRQGPAAAVLPRTSGRRRAGQPAAEPYAAAPRHWRRCRGRCRGFRAQGGVSPWAPQPLAGRCEQVTGKGELFGLAPVGSIAGKPDQVDRARRSDLVEIALPGRAEAAALTPGLMGAGAALVEVGEVEQAEAELGHNRTRLSKGAR